MGFLTGFKIIQNYHSEWISIVKLMLVSDLFRPNYETSDHPQYGRISLYNLKNLRTQLEMIVRNPPIAKRILIPANQLPSDGHSCTIYRLFFSMLEMSEWPTWGANFVFSSPSTTYINFDEYIIGTPISGVINSYLMPQNVPGSTNTDSNTIYR
ncbi:hypothetical protein B0H13DRAFT_1862502 [Mycena leptocephala]|nr:hypothetical protein B0H13DRAFT_1862502 [Mycena leptocephala]